MECYHYTRLSDMPHADSPWRNRVKQLDRQGRHGSRADEPERSNERQCCFQRHAQQEGKWKANLPNPLRGMKRLQEQVNLFISLAADTASSCTLPPLTPPHHQHHPLVVTAGPRCGAPWADEANRWVAGSPGGARVSLLFHTNTTTLAWPPLHLQRRALAASTRRQGKSPPPQQHDDYQRGGSLRGKAQQAKIKGSAVTMGPAAR